MVSRCGAGQQAPGYFAPGENFWIENVGNPDKPISKMELLYIEDLKDIATDGGVVDCQTFEHERTTVVKNTSGFATAHTIATKQDVHVVCENFLGRSGTFDYKAKLHKSPVTGVGAMQITIIGASGGLAGLKGTGVGTVGGPTTLSVQFN